MCMCVCIYLSPASLRGEVEMRKVSVSPSLTPLGGCGEYVYVLPFLLFEIL
jgi:hypothetical protein